MFHDTTIIPTRRLFEEDAYLRHSHGRVIECSPAGIILDQTIFYAESGGQPGDTGHLTLPDGQRIRVIDTQYLPGKVRITHVPEAPVGIAPGTVVTLDIDWGRRYAHMKMHTCLHVLCGLVDAPVTGCSIHAESSRLDFDLPDPVDKDALNSSLADAIASDALVSHRHASETDAIEALGGARTVNKRPADSGTVRLICIEGIDQQPCGGTHVAALGELAGLEIAKISKKSRHNRRVLVRFHEYRC